MDFGLERTKGTFNPDVLPRRRTVGSPVIRHCFVLVPPFVSLLNVQLARALRSLFRYRDDYSINERVTSRMRFFETLLKRGSIKIQYLRKLEGRVTRFGRKPEKYIDRCVPFFFAFFLDVLPSCFVHDFENIEEEDSLADRGKGRRAGGGENLMDFPPRVRTGVPFLRPRALLVSPQWKEHSGTNCYPLP